MRTLSMLLLAASLSTAACDDPADDVPAAEVHPTPEARSSEGAQAPSAHAEPAADGEDGHDAHIEGVALRAAEDSTVTFTGSKVTGSHDGGFARWHGRLTLDPEHLTASELVVQIDMRSVYSDDEDLTEHLKSADFFDVARFPVASFRSSRIVEGGEGGATHTVTGDLLLHGVTKTISFPARVAVTDDAVTATSEFSINRRDFGINYPGRPNDLIRDGVVVRLNIRAPRGRAEEEPMDPELIQMLEETADDLVGMGDDDTPAPQGTEAGER